MIFVKKEKLIVYSFVSQALLFIQYFYKTTSWTLMKHIEAKQKNKNT